MSRRCLGSVPSRLLELSHHVLPVVWPGAAAAVHAAAAPAAVARLGGRRAPEPSRGPDGRRCACRATISPRTLPPRAAGPTEGGAAAPAAAAPRPSGSHPTRSRGRATRCRRARREGVGSGADITKNRNGSSPGQAAPPPRRRRSCSGSSRVTAASRLPDERLGAAPRRKYAPRIRWERGRGIPARGAREGAHRSARELPPPNPAGGREKLDHELERSAARASRAPPHWLPPNGLGAAAAHHAS